MTDARKAAEATVKAAEKAYESVAKKAATAREKYAELQSEANRKARELLHAKANPDLYDDDPLSVVDPAGVTGDTVWAAALGNPTPTPSGNAVVGKAHIAITTPRVEVNGDVGPGNSASTGTRAAPPVDERVAPPEPSDTPPWVAQAQQPAQDEAPAAEKPKRTRRIGAKKPAGAEAAPPPPSSEVDQNGAANADDGDDEVIPPDAPAVAPGSPLSPF